MFWILLACAAALVLAQDVYPGQPIYHYGWYNAIDAGILVIALLQLRTFKPSAPILVGAFGAGVLVVAGIASGLMAPDTQTIVGAPGASVRSDDLGGSLVFPLNQAQPIVLQRGSGETAIGKSKRYTGGFVLWRKPRAVVYVQAADSRGQQLTITQPANGAFLSPVLLMQQSATIAGMNVRFDSFSVPAVGRSVKAVLFSAQQAAQLRAKTPLSGPAVLFAVSKSNADERNAIALAPSGQRTPVDALLLRGTVATYPAIVAASAPYVPALVLGLAACLYGALSSLRAGLRAAG